MGLNVRILDPLQIHRGDHYRRLVNSDAVARYFFFSYDCLLRNYISL